MPFTLNTMVLLPLLRSLPGASLVSVGTTLVAMTGLDFGVMGLGHPETAADDLVAWMMSFTIAAPLFWAGYMALHFWKWANGFIREWRSERS